MERYDAIIVGAGPAGLTAAIYLARARYRVLVIEKAAIGGQITITSEVVNYPGIRQTDGKRLSAAMREQAEAFGAEFLSGEAISFSLESDFKTITLKDGQTLQALGVILALGANPRKAGFVGEEAFKGRGVAYCATCDGEFFTGKEIFVIGSGLAAAEEALFLTRYGRKVSLLVRGGRLKCPESVTEKVKNNAAIQIHYHTQVTEAGGNSVLEYLVLRNCLTGAEKKYVPEAKDNIGIFVFAGYEPATAAVQGIVATDEAGYLLTDRNQQCSVAGVYGAGDVCVKNLRQVVTAVADGAVAATELEKVLAEKHIRLGLPKITISKDRERQIKTSLEETAAHQEQPAGMPGAFLDAALQQQLQGVFQKLTKPVLLRARLDSRSVSQEIRHFLQEICSLSDKLSYQCEEPEMAVATELLPEIRLETENGYSGISFHGVPGGHEINSLVVALYNLGGAGQQISSELRERILVFSQDIRLDVIATLACTMCPELVMASQRMASLNPRIEAHMFDLAHFPKFREQYQILSVPCLVINNEKVLFGKKDLAALTECIEEYLREKQR
jgi:thioredoxin reductase (NADPH)